MEIHKTDFNNGFNFRPELQPLFDAMKEGKLIKSITCIAGEINRNDRSKDFKLENFHALSYWVAFQQNNDGSKRFDYVDTDVEHPGKEKGSQKASFYMSWVISFEL